MNRSLNKSLESNSDMPCCDDNLQPINLLAPNSADHCNLGHQDVCGPGHNMQEFEVEWERLSVAEIMDEQFLEDLRASPELLTPGGSSGEEMSSKRAGKKRRAADTVRPTPLSRFPSIAHHHCPLLSHYLTLHSHMQYVRVCLQPSRSRSGSRCGGSDSDGDSPGAVRRVQRRRKAQEAKEQKERAAKRRAAQKERRQQDKLNAQKRRAGDWLGSRSALLHCASIHIC